MKLRYKLLAAALPLLLFAAPSGFATIVTVMAGGPNGMSFVPATGVTINLGDTIKWEWQNGSHTTTSTTIPAGAAPWDEPINSGTPSFIYVPSVAGVYNYICIPHQSMGMVGSFTVICTPPGTPNVNPGGLVSGCEGDSSVLLTATADPGVDFQWNFNGIPITGANNNQLLPDSSGVYSCTVTNDCGAATSNTATVILSPSPTPSFTYTNTDLDFTFTNTTLDTTLSWLWDFGDGATSAEQSPQHLFTAGQYTVTLTATDTAGNGCSGIATQQIDAGNTGIATVGSEASAGLLSPNPATAFVNIPVDEANITLQVYDINGRLMQKPYIAGKSKTAVRLNVSMLPAGSYFVRIITKDSAVTKKLIIRQ